MRNIVIAIFTVIMMILPAAQFSIDGTSGLILGLRSANERCCYKVTPSLIGWVQT